MHFADDLYISEKLTNKKGQKEKIMRDIKYGRGIKNYYLVYTNKDTKKLECMKSLYFRQKAYACQPFVIEGIISSYEEALNYMAEKTAIAMDVIYDN